MDAPACETAGISSAPSATIKHKTQAHRTLRVTYVIPLLVTTHLLPAQEVIRAYPTATGSEETAAGCGWLIS